MHYRNKSTLFKRFMLKSVAMLMTFCLFAVFLFSIVVANITASAENSYSPRLTEPASNNKYYFSDINVFYKYGYPMPNCTAYAYGRAYEILNAEPKLSIYSAQYWYDDNIEGKAYAYGQTPKLGAIACWKYNGGGHVAVVEKIEDGIITFSNSGYGYKNFYITTASTTADNPGQSNWTFQGYIYIGDFGTSSDTTPPAVGDIYKITSSDGVCLRDSATVSGKVLDYIPYNAKITVTKIKQSNDYTWGYTTYNGQAGWCAITYAQPVSSQSTVPVESDVVTSKKGDMNGDDKITIADATVLQKNLSGAYMLSQSQTKYADINGDGKVSVVDVTTIQKYIAGYINI